MAWYVLFVNSGKELTTLKWIEKTIEKDLINAIVPRRVLEERKQGEVSKVIRVVFNGYVFVCTKMTEVMYYQIKNIPTVIRMLGYGDCYEKIPNNQIVPILNLINENQIIESSRGYIKDSKLIIESGPLKDSNLIIKKVNKRKKRVTVNMDLLEQKESIDLAIELM